MVKITFALLFVFLGSANTYSASTSLNLITPNQSKSFDLEQLKAKLKVESFTVNDPVYKTKKTYEGFSLGDLLKEGGLTEAGGDEVVFHCADGYSPTMPFARLKEHRAMLAFEEKGASGGWRKFQQGKAWMTPAPYYVVWDTTAEAYPWPYQVVGIEVINFRKTYDKIFPEGAEKTSSVYRGFEHYRVSCLRCHSINLQGGEVGPEMNIPKNITEYWEEKTMRAFIRNPGDFRARSKMPPFPNLKDQELDDIVDYLKWARAHKKTS